MKELKITAATGGVRPAEVPGYVKENIAQVVYTSALRDWNNPEIRADYERWKAERKARATA